MSIQELIDNVEQWSVDRNLHTADPLKQMEKVKEEVAELDEALAIFTENKKIAPNMETEHQWYYYGGDVKDGIGDTMVTLIILVQQLGITLEECLGLAYDEIKDRKGRMINGTFIKEGDTRCVECGAKEDTSEVEGMYYCYDCQERSG